ncbi:DUF86 domain-containing protein [Limnohabitans sp. B9-3]|uniref:type VII toxin-antitoxin system HepT family RNase toxin n=1 Tax=Limnohabitans sp. B9-3 TaxID=1100707 RepID=UPI000C1E269F|nr:DUF86 domain-containing protein [Limnohabitans sp. B9-3]PIT72406.1 hypothetical protein B9Z42_12725 [Limnohabitans sp. B9-3]
MDRQVIDQKLESLFRCLSRIKAKFPADVSLLTSDFDLQDIVSLNLSRAVQLTVDIGGHIVSVSDFHSPETMGETFDVLAQNKVVSHDLAARLKKSVGFRNIAVHNYDAINWHIVHSIIKDHLGDFTEFAKAVIAWQNQQR